MDAFDFQAEQDKKKTPKRNVRGVLFRLGAYYLFAASLCLVGYFVMVFLNPQSSLNPLPPAQQAAQAEAPSASPVEITLTDTPAATEATNTLAVIPTETNIPERPTSTPAITNTFEPYPTATDVILQTSTVGPTAAVVSHYTAQEGTPTYLPYSGGCTGLYIAGNVVDLNNQPVAFMTVRVTGMLGEQEINLEALSGSNPNYTESGWEIKLSDNLTSSTQTLSVALYMQGNPDPVSDVITFDTSNQCTENLVVVNFEQDG